MIGKDRSQSPAVTRVSSNSSGGTNAAAAAAVAGSVQPAPGSQTVPTRVVSLPNPKTSAAAAAGDAGATTTGAAAIPTHGTSVSNHYVDSFRFQHQSA